jgi:hypothetical protein
MITARDMSAPDTGFSPDHQWLSAWDYTTGAQMRICTVCGASVIVSFSPVNWIVLDWGSLDLHGKPPPLPLDDWVDGVKGLDSL